MPSRRREMAYKVVSEQGVCIRDACVAFLLDYAWRLGKVPPSLRDNITLTRDTLCDTICLNIVVQRCESAS